MLKIGALLLAIIASPSIMRAQAAATPAQTADKDAAAKPDEKPAHIGGPMKAPVLVRSVDPEFTEEARKKNFKGYVLVYLWVDENGNPSHVRVVKGVGMGLDEKAVESVRQYKFKPAMQDGKPVKVDLYINVNFQLF